MLLQIRPESLRVVSGWRSTGRSARVESGPFEFNAFVSFGWFKRILVLYLKLFVEKDDWMSPGSHFVYDHDPRISICIGYAFTVPGIMGPELTSLIRLVKGKLIQSRG